MLMVYLNMDLAAFGHPSNRENVFLARGVGKEASSGSGVWSHGVFVSHPA
jgi:hypothetical protein